MLGFSRSLARSRRLGFSPLMAPLPFYRFLCLFGSLTQVGFLGPGGSLMTDRVLSQAGSLFGVRFLRTLGSLAITRFLQGYWLRSILLGFSELVARSSASVFSRLRGSRSDIWGFSNLLAPLRAFGFLPSHGYARLSGVSRPLRLALKY